MLRATNRSSAVESSRRAQLVAVGTALALAAAALGTTGAATPPDPNRLATKLVKDVKVDNVNRHLVALQRIGELNGGNRAASTPGHQASATYVADRLRAAGYVVQTQEFTFDYEETLAQSASVVTPTPRPLAPRVMSGSANTPADGLTAPLVALPGGAADTTPGCEPEDFTGATFTGAVALISRGSCPFATKVANAAAAGAVAVLVFNNVVDPNEALSGTLGGPAAVAAAGLTRAEGEALVADLALGAVTVTLDLRVLRESRTTYNVITETPGGRADNVVMSGAHLDSVVPGPGINDNGTGSAAQLELAIRLAKYKPKNKVRFAWWGAEEFGLVGSRYYVSKLTQEQQLDIALYLNFDMIGSPNFGRFIYDGDNSDNVGAGPGPFGSAQIESLFAQYLDGRGLTHEGTDFSGRSDYGPFIAVAIPSGGLFTGAEGRKTEAQVALYGGTAGEPYDKCYHQACDTLGNVNRVVLDQMSDAMAWAVGVYGISTAPVNGNGSAAAKQQRRQAAAVAMSARSALTGVEALAAQHAQCGHVVI